MAKGIRVNNVNLGRRIQKQRRMKAKHNKKNVAANKDMLKKLQTGQEGQESSTHLTRFRSTRQKKLARKMMQRKEKAKSQMDVESKSTASSTTTTTTTTTTTNVKIEKKQNTKKTEGGDDNEMICD